MEQISFESFLWIGVTLLIFKIDGKTPDENERLNNSVNWNEISLLSNLRTLVGMLFGPFAFSGLRDEIISDTSVLSVGDTKKEFTLILGRKPDNVLFECLIVLS